MKRKTKRQEMIELYQRDVELTRRIATDVERRMRESDEADAAWDREQAAVRPVRQMTLWEE